jgi:hypothetical protein
LAIVESVFPLIIVLVLVLLRAGMRLDAQQERVDDFS